jgi:hypothetical protein
MLAAIAADEWPPGRRKKMNMEDTQHAGMQAK